MSTRISMIAAMTKNRVIGFEKDLPWHLPDDFQYFKDKTRGHHVIMGRKNFESLPDRFRPLPDRTNIVLTRQPDYQREGITTFSDLNEAISFAKQHDEEPFIIGGGEIYRLGLPLADRIYLTEINTIIDGDTFFPEFDPTDWVEMDRRHHPKDDRHRFSFDFVIYDKK